MPCVRLRRVAWTAVAVIVVVGGGSLAATKYRQAKIELQANAALSGVGQRAIPIMQANGCAGCHTISGVPGAQGQIGPRLDSTLVSKLYIAGVLPNSRENMIQWLRSSRELVPHTAMTSTGISEQEARDVAAYLYAMR